MLRYVSAKLYLTPMAGAATIIYKTKRNETIKLIALGFTRDSESEARLLIEDEEMVRVFSDTEFGYGDFIPLGLEVPPDTEVKVICKDLDESDDPAYFTLLYEV